MFNSSGYLFPAEPITFSDLEIRTLFLQNEYRQNLYNEYLHYTNELKNLIEIEFEQWLDGSFATAKSTPKDIDIVNFIQADKVNLYEKEIQKLKGNYPNLDIYTVKVYSDLDKNFVYYYTDRLYWLDLFSHTRPNSRSGKKMEKGFISIKHTL